MRGWASAVLFAVGAVLLDGCGELSGAAPYSDAFTAPIDGSRPETSRPDASGINALDGDYYHEPIQETRAAFRLESTKTPENPWIIFISTTSRNALGCDVFQDASWHKDLPTSAVVHAIRLGARAPGTYRVGREELPPSNGAFVGRTTESDAETISYERAVSGEVIISRYDVTGVAGSLDVTFHAYFTDDPDPDAGAVPQRVRGTFAVTGCTVSW